MAQWIAMDERIIGRVLRRSGVPDLVEVLARRLSRSEAQTLLLEVSRERARAATPADVLRQYERDSFVQPSDADPRRLLAFDVLAFAQLPEDFEALELSPVCPLGTVSVVSPLDQSQAVATIRNTEVSSDSTNVLALECARRRRTIAVRDAETKLCASHRLLRPHFPKGPASFPHFRILTLCTAGRDRGSYAFEVAALVEHLDYYARLLRDSRSAGFAVGAVRVSLSVFDDARAEVVERDVIGALTALHPEVRFELDRENREGSGYYLGVRFRIYASDMAGQEYFLADGGLTEWTQLLLADRKERLLISGLGSERFVACFDVA